MLEIPLRSGAGVRGHLRLGSEEGVRRAISRGTIQRLSALCTMAACAMERLRGSAERPWDNDTVDQADELQSVNQAHGSVWARSTILPSPTLHDATFMSAILPFALGQAKRHRESLSLLCVSVDRLGGITELLGRPAADLLVRNVGESVASLLRSSDIAVRLDDDRIVAILPRAACENGLRVAEKIRAQIADKNSEADLMPGVTVSIGVATYPTSATNMTSLLEAADHALAQARSQGRDQSVLANPCPNAEPTTHLQTLHHGVSERLATTLF